jgi:uncharacterized protein YceH (UPF0502 family)
VVKLERSPGEREARWAHLLCGDPPAPAMRSAANDADGGSLSAGELSALKAEQTRLATEVESLKAQVQRLHRELGLAPE